VTLSEQVEEVLSRHPAVRRVTLVGSRARADATDLSDWDFQVTTDDFATLASDLPRLTAPLQPLGSLWDRLADIATYMLILRGPVKVDFLFDDVPNEPLPPYDLARDELAAIDVHFWDWCLWLTSKVAKGKAGLVHDELGKMQRYILEPLGGERPPQDLLDAVDTYLELRRRQERSLGRRVPRDVGDQVVRVIGNQRHREATRER
jgi:hypothetical protein